VALLKYKAELKHKRILDYKKRLTEEARKDVHVKETPKSTSRPISINISHNLRVRKKSKTPPRFKVEDQEEEGPENSPKKIRPILKLAGSYMAQ
jgi:hypothetical protein